MLIHSPKELAKLLYSERKRHRLSQAKAGSKVGLKQTTISHFETNPERTQVTTLFRILASLDLEIHVTPKSENIKIGSKKIRKDTEKQVKSWKEKW
jgi:HTH-type transcriptional regulator / antitoxin HipB